DIVTVSKGNLLPKVTGEATYKAYFNKRDKLFTIVWRNWDETVIDTTVGKKYGEPTTNNLTEVPTRPETDEFTFEYYGWKDSNGVLYTDAGLPTVSGNETYTAVFTPIRKSYLIQFKTFDGETILSRKEYPYGTSAEDIIQPTAPKRTPNDQYSYEFVGWTPELQTVTKAMDYIAVYREVLRPYTVTWVNWDGTELEKEEYYYGTMPSYPGAEVPTRQPDAEYSYTFKRWVNADNGNAIEKVSGDVTYKAEYASTKNKYYVTWKDGNGNELRVDVVEYGETPVYRGATPTKTSDKQFDYTWNKGWDPEVSVVTGNITYTATFGTNTRAYLITFVDENGYDIVDHETGERYQSHQYYGTHAEDLPVPAADDVPHKMADPYFTYVFKGWFPMVNDVTGDAIYRATYQAVPRMYLVAHMNDDTVYTIATKIALEDIEGYAPGLIERVNESTGDVRWLLEGIDLTPWAGIVTDLKEDGKTDIITIRNDGNGTFTMTIANGTLLEKQWLPYGASITYSGVDPVSTDTSGKYYSTFTGWTPKVNNVFADTVMVANYNRTEGTYKVTWLDGDRKELYTEEVLYGTVPRYSGATPTKTPTKDKEYVFNGTWSPSLTDKEGKPIQVTRDMTFTAEFTAKDRVYSVKFVDEDGTTVLLDAINYPYGTEVKDIKQPADPTKPSDGTTVYTFSGWMPLVHDVTEDIVYKATYNGRKESYIVTWIVDGVKTTETYKYGDIPTYQMGATPTKATDQYYSYTFTGWDRPIVQVTKDATYEAQFAKRPLLYTVVWTIGDERISEKHAYGSILTEPENPTRPGYVFLGWDKKVPDYMPAEDLSFTAVWEKALYGVRFYNYDGELLEFQQLYYLDVPVYTGPVPTREKDEKYTYTFAGWTPTVTEVLGDAVYTAVFTAELRLYTVKFVNDDGTVLQSGKVAYGKLPVYEGKTPTKAPTESKVFTFAGWNPMIERVTGNAVYTATYTSTAREYTIKFVNDDGTVLQTEKVAYGDMPTYKGDEPTKAPDKTKVYDFAGWTPEIEKVTGDAIYTATYTSKTRLYTIKFVNDDGSVLDTQMLEYGEKPVYTGETPEKKTDSAYSYLFRDWTPKIRKVTKDAIYTATYYATPLYALIATMKSYGSTSMNIAWTRVGGASGYDIFFSHCNTNTKKYVPKLIRTVDNMGNVSNASRLSIKVTGLNKGETYKAYVRAFRMVNGKKVYIAKSPMVHAITNGCNNRYTNAKSIKVSKTKVNLRVGHSQKIKATVEGLKSGKIILAQKHASLVRYYSSDTSVAQVTSTGKIIAVGKGICTIFCLTPNGVFTTIMVTVK
ncbi:MAG: InlB B-repeat-containing protein, partial [Oscillospiraceae bacterium]|nr:InlB B-repeat-containing protein [Oscillospiraceae bacterium]